MLSGYADEHVDARIVAGLRRHGMDVVTAQQRGQRATDDKILLTTASSEGRLMLTNDVDFLRLHNNWMTSGKSHAGILFWPQKRPIGTAIRRILAYASQTDPGAAANMLTYL